jgi:hypothetical protein
MVKANNAGVQPEAQLNPKKKVFETIQPVSFTAQSAEGSADS